MVVIELKRLQAELGGLVFGAGTDVLLETIDGLGAGELRNAEHPLPYEDGVVFGREFRNGRVLEFVGEVVVAGDEAGAWNRTAQLAAAFDPPERLESRAVVPLRLQRPGATTKIAYGRPDKFDPAVQQAVVGLVPFQGTFRMEGNSWYGDVEKSVLIRMSATTSGAIVTTPEGDLPSPITTVPGSAKNTVADNEGDAPTWPVIKIRGPITAPRVRLLDAEGGAMWELGLTGTLAYDREVTFDTRPWARTNTIDGGGPVGGMTLASVPSRATIPPGRWDIRVSGADSTGTAEFEVLFRDGYRNV